MSIATITKTSVLEVTDCCVCGVTFAVPEHLLARRRETGKDFYCPNGHTLRYHETDLMRWQKRAKAAEAQLTAERDQHAATKRTNAGLRGEITRQRRRSAAGVCPCCHRTLQQLARHMRSQHPDYVDEPVPG